VGTRNGVAVGLEDGVAVGPEDGVTVDGLADGMMLVGAIDGTACSLRGYDSTLWKDTSFISVDSIICSFELFRPIG